jgi:hypothetical protein
MLKPVGIPRAAWVQEGWSPRDDYPEWVSEAAAPCLIVGETHLRKTPVFSPDGCFPDSVGALIVTDRGLRRLQGEELAKAKGVPSEWIRQDDLPVRTINHLMDLHVWTAEAASFALQTEDGEAPLYSPASDPVEESEWRPLDEDDLEWNWKAPDLSIGGEWHTARVNNLREAANERTP